MSENSAAHRTVHGVARRDQARSPTLGFRPASSLDPARPGVKPRVPRDQDPRSFRRIPAAGQSAAPRGGPLRSSPPHSSRFPDPGPGPAARHPPAGNACRAGHDEAGSTGWGGRKPGLPPGASSAGITSKAAARGTGRRRQVPRSARKRLLLQVDLHGLQSHPRRTRRIPGQGEPHGETSARVTSRPRLRQPDRIGSRHRRPRPGARPCRGSMDSWATRKGQRLAGSRPLLAILASQRLFDEDGLMRSTGRTLDPPLTPALRVRSPTSGDLVRSRSQATGPADTGGQNRPSSVRSHQSREPHRVNRYESSRARMSRGAAPGRDRRGAGPGRRANLPAAAARTARNHGWRPAVPAQRGEPHLPVEPRQVERGEPRPPVGLAGLPAEAVRPPGPSVVAPLDDDLGPPRGHHGEEAVASWRSAGAPVRSGARPARRGSAPRARPPRASARPSRARAPSRRRR